MAVGDVVSNLQSVSASAYLTIQPSAGVEWVIHNIYHESDIEVYFTNGTNEVKVDSESGNGDLQGVWHVTNSYYLKVKNVDTAAKLIGYDGVVTK